MTVISEVLNFKFQIFSRLCTNNQLLHSLCLDVCLHALHLPDHAKLKYFHHSCYIQYVPKWILIIYDVEMCVSLSPVWLVIEMVRWIKT